MEAEPMADEDTPPKPIEWDSGSIAEGGLSTQNVDGYTQQSFNQKLSEEIAQVIGINQVTAAVLQIPPNWIVEEAIRSEMSSN